MCLKLEVCTYEFHGPCEISVVTSNLLYGVVFI